ncbi:hypothetical protein [Candidatus Similichlamydia epinepheli]|uniref:hypothetical protein n=1 Tax=Candidatus Similichlamydia epinepheli TaxID=1903953 RepID=UPI0013005952|nr:hypothetical protein [Candidatus Similichlamydia epinepheli]
MEAKKTYFCSVKKHDFTKNLYFVACFIFTFLPTWIDFYILDSFMIAFSVPVFLSYMSVSEQSGCFYWVPCTFFVVQIFPALISFFDVRGEELRPICTWRVTTEHEIDNFRVECDWDRQRIIVTLQVKKNVSVLFFQMGSSQLSCLFSFARGTSISVDYESGVQIGNLTRGEAIELFIDGTHRMSKKDVYDHPQIVLPRLSFGSHKKKCFHTFDKRCSREDIFPCLYALSKLLPSDVVGCVECTVSDQELIHTDFVSVWRYHFSTTMVPFWQDQRFYGAGPFFKGYGSPLNILSYVGKSIIDSLVRLDESTLFVLPERPKWSTAGRLRSFLLPFGSFSIIWSNCRLRSCLLKIDQTNFCYFVFPPEVRVFRATRKGGGPGMYHVVGSEPVPFFFKEGDVYCFDRFEH